MRRATSNKNLKYLVLLKCSEEDYLKPHIKISLKAMVSMDMMRFFSILVVRKYFLFQKTSNYVQGIQVNSYYSIS